MLGPGPVPANQTTSVSSLDFDKPPTSFFSYIQGIAAEISFRSVSFRFMTVTRVGTDALVSKD